MKCIGFNQGQYGDLCMNTIACRALKEKFPECELHFGINKKYASLAPIFENHPLINKIHIWDAYDDWPSEKDRQHISKEEYDFTFNAMPKHTQDHWYINHHQTAETCYMHGLIPPKNLQVELHKYFDTERNKKHVALNLYAETRGFTKIPNFEQAKKISDLIKSKGYTPVQIGLPDQPQICEKRFIGSFFDSVKFTLSCDFLFTVDSAMSWIASGYSFPTLGIYSYTYYPYVSTSKNWQPINPNAKYLEKDKISNITLDSISEEIDKML
jgi:ADP-heptose:LPS heptosyltransferase